MTPAGTSNATFAILGAGQMGKALAYDLANSGVEDIMVADRDVGRARDVARFIGRHVSCARELDLSDRKAVASLMKDADVAISAASYRLNLMLTEIAIETKTHMCDLGGNPEVVDAQLALSPLAEKAGVTIVPDCGLAPGLTNVLVARGFQELDTVEDVQIRVGGLPQDPKPPLHYGLLFSAEGLINEYVEKARVVRDGQIVEVESLTGVEDFDFYTAHGSGSRNSKLEAGRSNSTSAMARVEANCQDIEFPKILRKLEAFYTSGGTSTLPRTYGGQDCRVSQARLKNLDYKTIRYAGHCEKMRFLLELGLMNSKSLSLIGGATVSPRKVLERLLETQLPPAGKDITLLRVTIRGTKDSKPATRVFEMLDRFDESTGLSSMMRTTAFPTSIIAQMIARGEITKRGVLPPELCVPTGTFLHELAKRLISIESSSKS